MMCLSCRISKTYGFQHFNLILKGKTLAPGTVLVFSIDDLSILRDTLEFSICILLNRSVTCRRAVYESDTSCDVVVS